jgi:hypothetical protein
VNGEEDESHKAAQASLDIAEEDGEDIYHEHDKWDPSRVLVSGVCGVGRLMRRPRSADG